MMSADYKEGMMPFNFFCLINNKRDIYLGNTSFVERKEEIEKVEEKERLQKEKEEKERKDAELAAQPGKGDSEEVKADDNEKVEGSTDGEEEMPGAYQDSEDLDENEHHDEIGNYKDFPTDEVSSSLVN